MTLADFPLLFSPFRLGHAEAPNRIVSTSHGTNMAVDGAPGERLVAYHAAKAAGGCGTVMMIGSAAASPLTPISPNHVNLWQDRAVPGLRAAAAAVKAHGALAISQVTSMSRRSAHHLDLVGRRPSASGSQLAPHLPHVLSTAEIGQLVDDYAAACLRLKECGFDGCDLAFYDDQPPDQFWSPSINLRTDAYGGSLENRMRFSLEVLIVGGGPAGMETARVAAERGHRVTLLEQADQLGGAIRLAARAPGWEAYRGVVDWLARQLVQQRVEVLLERTAAVESILAYAPDEVVIATGATPRRPRLPGVDGSNVATVADDLAGTVAVGPRCVILDETGYTPGPKLADALSAAGHQVEIVTRQYSLGEDIGTTVRAKLYERLLRQGVTITVLTAPTSIHAGGVRVRHMLTDTEGEIAADTVILSSGGVAQNGLYHALSAASAGQDRAPGPHLIGDAYAPRTLRLAMLDGARVGRAL